MRRLIVTTLVAGLAAVGATAAAGGHSTSVAHAKKGKSAKVLLCHRGHAIRVAEKALAAHVRHGDLVGACKVAKFPARFALLRTRLTPVAGATGSGTALVGIAAFRGGVTVLCYRVAVRGVASTAAHIHTSTAQTIGNTSFAANAIVVPFKTPNASGLARGCMLVERAVARALLANPGNFYVNVHSAVFPGGQVQGILTRAA